MSETVKISELVPDTRNANRGTERGKRMLKTSIERYGTGRSVLLDKNLKVIAGNKTHAQAAESGIEEVIIVRTRGDQLVAVIREDLDLDTDVRARELAYADNRVAEVDLDFDMQMIADDAAAGIDFGGMWSQTEIDAMLAELATDPNPEDVAVPEARLDRAQELQAKWGVAQGQVWEIGRHRLLCGDSTLQENVDRLMMGGTCDLVFTDPPYGVAYVGKTKDRLTIQNDELGDDRVRELVATALSVAPLRPGTVFYVCSPAGSTETAFRLALADAGLELRQCLVWVKQAFVLGRQDYHWRHESILYGWKAGAAHFFIPDRSQDTVWEVDRPSRNAEHPTMKPTELIAKAILNSSLPGQIVFDGFGGSGSTMATAEATGRVCRSIELEEKYCAVILERMTEMGLTPTLCDHTLGSDAHD